MGLGVAIVLAIAIPLGLLAGYYGGLIDDGFFGWCRSWSPPPFGRPDPDRVLDPAHPLSLALLIGLFAWMGNARQARGADAADQALGLRHGRTGPGVAGRADHVPPHQPNMVSLMLVLAGFDVVAGILAEAGLSFLGLGIRPPIPSWGNMLTNSLTYVFRAPFLVVFPGLAIGLLVLCVYMLTDGLRTPSTPG